MKYFKSEKYNTPELQAKIMGPNPVKLEEELLINHSIPEGSVVCDLGSGQGLTSVFLAKEYGFTVYAADLWSDPEENRKFFDAMTADKETYSAFKQAKQKGEKEKILRQYPRFADTFKMVAKMDKLFDIERSLKAEQADPERIKEVRNEKARPIMEEIHEYNNYLKVTVM